MRLIILLILSLGTSACTSMLAGGSGESAGNPIGVEDRGGDQMSRDRDISAAVRSRFAADAQLASLNLGVDTRHGAVTLRGTANSFDLRDRALNLAADVAGVVRIDNQISVNTR
jgi:osmotically-inducible protein OsmY